MAEKDRLELPEHLRRTYLQAQMERTAHRMMREAVEDALNLRAGQGLPVPTVDDRVEPVDVRLARVAKRTMRLLSAGDSLSLADWTDLWEFHTFGEENATLIAARLDDDEFVRRIIDAPPLAVSAALQQDVDTVSQIGLTWRRWYRLCAPGEKRLFLKLLEMLDEPGHGLVAFRDEHGERHNLPYMGARELTRAG